ncbi:MAG: family 10 glycosylhydrolase, partial [Armatimonadota bacterium]|nr:family 10 glycosylhydrolase [Armatimonadota bacterium]
EDQSASGRVVPRSPAVISGPRSVYFAPNVLLEATEGREMLRLLVNAMGVLLPGSAPDPGRLGLAELDVVLAAARRSATGPEAAALLAAAEAKAAAAVAQAQAQSSPPVVAAADPAPSELLGTPATNGELSSTDTARLTPPASAAPIRPEPSAVALIADAIDAAERVALLARPCRENEARGVLLPRTLLPPSRTAIAQLLDQLRAAGINMVLPEVYGGGVSLTPGTNQDPRFAGHDPLASLLAEAGPRGIAVHAWVSLLSTGTPGPKSPFPPGWSAQTRAGARYLSYGQYWFCPTQTEVRDAVCEGIRRSLNGYAVQGVLLDGVDYGGVPEACFDPTCVALFRGDTGRNPRTDTLAPEWEAEWLRWRRDRVSTLVRRVIREIRTGRPGLPVHVGISTVGVEPRSNSIADWREWSRQRWVDGVCVELDTGNVDEARRAAERVGRLAPEARVLPLLSSSRVRTPQHVLDLVAAVQEGGGAGILFDMPGPVAERWGASLNRGPFRRAARLPW